MGLLYWTLYRTIRAKHTTISFQWLQQCLTILAFVEILTCVRGHRLFFLVTTIRTCEQGFKNYCGFHYFPSSMINNSLINGYRLYPLSLFSAWVIVILQCTPVAQSICFRKNTLSDQPMCWKRQAGERIQKALEDYRPSYCSCQTYSISAVPIFYLQMALPLFNISVLIKEFFSIGLHLKSLRGIISKISFTSMESNLSVN